MKNIYFCCIWNHRLPYDTHQPVSFGIALFAEYLQCQIFLSISITFMIFYISICMYFRSFMEDLSMIIEPEDKAMDQRSPIKQKFVQFVQLHEHLYGYVNIYYFVIYPSFEPGVKMFTHDRISCKMIVKSEIRNRRYIHMHQFARSMKVNQHTKQIHFLNCCILFLRSSMNRILRKFESIISVPIFFQLPVFGLVLAIILYQVEDVSK